MSDNDEDDDTVGYCHPPRKNRFPPGQSGNPQGRPKTPKSIAQDMHDELKSMVPVTENGKRKKLSKQRIMVKQIAGKAIKGDVRAFRETIALTGQIDSAAGKSTASIFDREADRIIIGNFRARMRDSTWLNEEPLADSDKDELA